MIGPSVYDVGFKMTAEVMCKWVLMELEQLDLKPLRDSVVVKQTLWKHVETLCLNFIQQNKKTEKHKESKTEHVLLKIIWVHFNYSISFLHRIPWCIFSKAVSINDLSDRPFLFCLYTSVNKEIMIFNNHLYNRANVNRCQRNTKIQSRSSVLYKHLHSNDGDKYCPLSLSRKQTQASWQ